MFYKTLFLTTVYKIISTIAYIKDSNLNGHKKEK